MEGNKIITPREVYLYYDALEMENRRLHERVAYLEEHCVIADKFYNSALGVGVVAELHGVDPNTVRSYIGKGLIPCHPKSVDAKFLIRGSDALRLDFQKLRRMR